MNPISVRLALNPAGKLDEHTASAIHGFIFSPYITYLLYLSILLVLVGLATRLHKLSATGGLAIILISAFRAFSTQLTSDTGIFQAKVVIPIFALTILCKFVSDYLRKGAEEEKEDKENEEKPAHKRRAVNAKVKHEVQFETKTETKKFSGGLTRFGDSQEKRSQANKSIGNGAGNNSVQANSAPIPKLNRSF